MTRIPDRGIAVIAADGCFMVALFQLGQESGLWGPVIVPGGSGGPERPGRHQVGSCISPS